MIETFKTVQFWTKAVFANRKGATAVEYALIAAAAAAVVGIGFNAFFDKIRDYLNAINFDKTA